jgi:hypothetical protein
MTGLFLVLAFLLCGAGVAAQALLIFTLLLPV